MKLVWVALVAVAFGCGDNSAGTPDAMADATPTVDASFGDLPAKLLQTGLYADDNRDALASGVLEYTVKYPLWTDGAEKRRFVLLPAGEQINAADPDFWRFPQGTRVWKQFALGGSRLETRYLIKTGPFPQDWKMAAYVWDTGETEALLTVDGLENVHGTDHDVPGQDDCRRCHRHQPDIVIGIGGVQLNHAMAGANLASLISDSLISDDVQGVSFDLPGDADAQAALGYLHGNCGPCHKDNSDVQKSITMRLFLKSAGLDAVDNTTIYQTAVSQTPSLPFSGGTSLIEPGQASSSVVFLRMGMRGDGQMPPLGTEQVDTPATTAVETWINSLAP